MKVTGGQGRGRKQLLNDLKALGVYWILDEEALDRIQLRTRFGEAVDLASDRLRNEWIMARDNVACVNFNTKSSL